MQSQTTDIGGPRVTQVPALLDVCIVGGCGHVGLPLALAFANSGLQVGIFDTSAEKVEMVASGKMPFMEEGADELLVNVLGTDRLHLSTDPAILRESRTVVFIVGTPIDEFLNPSLRAFGNVLDQVEPNINDGTLLVLRSTVYPGVTEWVTNLLRERGREIDVVFCPERIVEGHALEELASLPQIIGAESESAADQASPPRRR